jgi:predicted Zn-dependent protease
VRSRWRRLALAGAVLVFGCDTPTVPGDAPAYEASGLTGFTYHWGPGRELALFVDGAAAPAATDLVADVRHGMQHWARATRLGEIRWTLVRDPSEADVIIRHTAAPTRVGTVPCPRFGLAAAGVTFFCVSGGQQALTLPLLSGQPSRVKMEVIVNRSRADDAEHFRAIVVHELGHVLGLGAHSSTATDVMFAFPRRSTPSADDARTLRHLLGRGVDVRF